MAETRLFFALWPEPEVRGQLHDVQLLFESSTARPLSPELFHMTLVYLGASSSQQRACYEKVADQVRGHCFELSLEQSGCFHRAQVAYSAPSVTPDDLMQLNGQLKESLHECCGVTPEMRPFRPHVTLFRKYRSKTTPDQNLRVNWFVDRFALVSSVSTKHGVEYRPLRFWALNKP